MQELAEPLTTTDPQETQTEAPSAEVADGQGGDAESAPIVPPAFDLVRTESDGLTLVAGRAMAGALVSILLDGEEIARATADNAGRFVEFVEVPGTGKPRVLALLMHVDTA